jgi:mono/diheme cytochrome c family protein
MANVTSLPARIRRRYSSVILAIFALLVTDVQTLLAAKPDTKPAASPAHVDFERQISPLLTKHCLSCHNSNQLKGGLDLSAAAKARKGGDNGPSLVPSRPTESWLLDMLTPGEDGSRPEMPAKGEPLSCEQVALLQRWIAEGAPWPEGLILREPSKADRSWWSLQPLAKALAPQVPNIPPDWAAQPIDRFVFAQLAARGLKPNPEADRRSLIRRATYDLLGLPPSPEEIEQFVADSRPDAYERLVERLLASPHYGEQWGRHWLDVVRFGESRGFERNQIIDNAWPFRDYVIRSFNDDKPFDHLIVEHMAGDVIGKDQPDVEVGTTFLVSGPYDDVGNKDLVQAAQIRANTVDDTIRACGEAFLGLTIGCARCHDHKFDPIRQDDYYSFYATLAGVKHGSRTIATTDARKSHDEKLKPLLAEKEMLTKQQEVLEATVLKRAESHIADYDRQWSRPAAVYSLAEEPFPPTKARYVRLLTDGTSIDPVGTSNYMIDEFEVFNVDQAPRNVALASTGAKAEGAGRVAEDFKNAYRADLAIDGKYEAAWNALGPELKITLAKDEMIGRVVFSTNRNNDFSRTYPAEYRIEVSLDGRQWTQVAGSQDRKPASDAHRRKRLLDAETSTDERKSLTTIAQSLRRLGKEIDAVPELPLWWAGQFSKEDGPFFVFLGGDPQKHGAEVKPSGLAALDNCGACYQLATSGSEADRRLALARWMTDPRNPLTPRVLANRVWHYHFCTGLVDTPSDFGYLGSRPTHPELLDWLAGRLIEHEWKLKPLHREIMLSRTYRQSSLYRETAAGVDAGSRYLWRFPPRRLSAEEIRDTFLSVAGKLDDRMGGPGFRLYHYMQDNVATYEPLDVHGPQTYRRSVYHQNARASRIDLLSEFDCPDSASPAPTRSSTTTPLQALTLLNHSFTLDMSRFLAQRLERDAGTKRPEEQVRRGFELLGGRAPSADETSAAVELVRSYGLPAFCRALLNSNELMYLD